MKLVDILVENPITDIKLLGSQKDSHSIHSRDMRLLQNEKAVEKIQGQWEDTPWNVRVYLVNLPSIGSHDISLEGGDKKVIWILYNQNLKKDTFARDFGNDIADAVWPASDEISVVFTHNVSMKNTIPMTGWMIAHRLYHAFSFNNSRAQMESGELKALFKRAGEKFRKSPEDLMKKVFTFKSINDKGLNTGLELLPELFAQWMLTGGNKLEPFVAGETTDFDKDLRNIMQDLQANFTSLMDKAEGRLLVF